LWPRLGYLGHRIYLPRTYPSDPGVSLKLGRATIANLHLPQGRSEFTYFDSDIGGFGIRIRESGSRSWVFQYDIAGKTKRITIGKCTAIDSAKANHADIVVAPFPDPIGRDAIIAWPGGVYMQLYWHRTPSNYASLQTVPENRVYISPDRADSFVRDFGAFAQAKVISDDHKAPGIEIGRPNDVYRRARMDSPFGKITVLATDGHLPYPYGREITGYEVDDLSNTLMKAKAAGASVVIEPYSVAGRRAAMVRFPGGFIAEVHSDNNK